MKTNILVISASMRKESQSLKVSNWLVDHAKSLGCDADLVDLNKTTLPMFDLETPADNKDEIVGKIAKADGVVFVSPEWAGTMSHGLINMMHYVGTELAHKPVMLTGVSAGRGGQYPVMQMRSMQYKNSHFVISPEALVVQDCNNMLNDHDMNDEADDIIIKKRADYSLKILVEYAKALGSVRDSGVVDHESFPYGM